MPSACRTSASTWSGCRRARPPRNATGTPGRTSFVYVLEGELALITDAGAQTLVPGMVAGFPANTPDGHHLVNRTEKDAVYLEVGDRLEGDEVEYPDIDLAVRLIDGRQAFTHKDGTPY